MAFQSSDGSNENVFRNSIRSYRSSLVLPQPVVCQSADRLKFEVAIAWNLEAPVTPLLREGILAHELKRIGCVLCWF